MKLNAHLKEKECGTDHYGHWHARGHQHDPIVETADSVDLKGAAIKQLLYQFLHYTGGSITRVLDFRFGVWDPELREEYRRVYRESPRFARLPPTNDCHDETYILRVVISNRPTDEHIDGDYRKKGLNGLCQIGKFQGAAMCFNQLHLKLNGYKSGAILLFRGRELFHYVSPWEGECRYAFDHTTHKSVRQAVDLEREGTTKPPADGSAEGKKRKRSMTEDKSPNEDEPEPPLKKSKARAARAKKTKGPDVTKDEASNKEKRETPEKKSKARAPRAKKSKDLGLVADEASNQGEPKSPMGKTRARAPQPKKAEDIELVNDEASNQEEPKVPQRKTKARAPRAKKGYRC